MTQQLAIPGSQEFEKPSQALSPMDLLQIALQKDAAIDVIERLAKLQLEMQMSHAEIAFNDALSQCQAEVATVVPDASANNQKYATYKALDAAVRPVYIRHGFSLSFDSADCPVAERIRVICLCSRGMYTRKYQIDVSVDGSGPKGGQVLTKTHADLAANSYGKRRLLRNIFNIVDSEDETLTNSWLMEKLQLIEKSEDLPELEREFKAAYLEAKKEKATDAMLALVTAKDRRKAALQS